MRAHNQGCVTSLASLQRFYVTNGRSKGIEKQKTLSRYFGVFTTCKEKANGAGAEEPWLE
jgi:hypothetical protein